MTPLFDSPLLSMIFLFNSPLLGMILLFDCPLLGIIPILQLFVGFPRKKACSTQVMYVEYFVRFEIEPRDSLSIEEGVVCYQTLDPVEDIFQSEELSPDHN